MSVPPDPLPEFIFHICAAADWQAAQRAGVYRGSASARADGFLHLSTAEQVAGSLAKHYPNPDGFVVLTVRVAALGDRLRWEPSRGGALFPHCYGEVPLDAVMAIVPARDWTAAGIARQPAP